MNALTMMGVDGSTTYISNNADSFDAVIRDVRKLGADSARGADARPKLFERCVMGGYTGALMIDDKEAAKDKRKLGLDPRDHAAQIYDEYVATEAKKSEHGEQTKKGKASVLRAAIQLGGRSLGGTDGIEIFETFKKVHAELRAQKGIKVWSAWEAFYRASLKQNESSVVLGEDEIAAAMRKEDAEPKDRDEGYFLRVAKENLDKALEKNERDETKHIREQLEGLLAALGREEQRAAAIRMAQEAGLTVVETPAPEQAAA